MSIFFTIVFAFLYYLALFSGIHYHIFYNEWIFTIGMILMVWITPLVVSYTKLFDKWFNAIHTIFFYSIFLTTPLYVFFYSYMWKDSTPWHETLDHLWSFLSWITLLFSMVVAYALYHTNKVYIYRKNLIKDELEILKKIIWKAKKEKKEELINEFLLKVKEYEIYRYESWDIKLLHQDSSPVDQRFLMKTALDYLDEKDLKLFFKNNMRDDNDFDELRNYLR